MEKPPGSGQSAPLLFGAAAKIQLPTPSKPSNTPQTGIFGSTNPFGSTTTFGGTFSQPSKKRSLEATDQAVTNESVKKQSRTEGEKEKQEKKQETSAIKSEKDQKNEEKPGEG